MYKFRPAICLTIVFVLFFSITLKPAISEEIKNDVVTSHEPEERMSDAQVISKKSSNKLIWSLVGLVAIAAAAGLLVSGGSDSGGGGSNNSTVPPTTGDYDYSW